MRRRIGPAAALALLALAACTEDGSPGASPSPSSAPATSAPATTASTPSAPASPSWPAGCLSPYALRPGTIVIEATVAGGAVSPARRTYDVKLRNVVRLLVTADVADEVHLHSYDRRVKTEPGCPAMIEFEAGIPGTVEVELEGAGLHLLDVRAR